jgi:transposase
VLFAYSAGGRPGEQLMHRLGMPVSDDTILRRLKRHARAQTAKTVSRAVGIDDWSWRKGSSYNTILVDLERRQVIDVLPDRSATATARWLDEHPEIDVISRDRCGLYAQGAEQGAPQAKQIADRFHLLQNLRDAITAQLGRDAGFLRSPVIAEPDCRAEKEPNVSRSPRGELEVAEHHYLVKTANTQSRQTLVDQVTALRASGASTTRIINETGIKQRRVTKWLQACALPTRRPMQPKTCSPSFFQDYLSRRWAEGIVRGRKLFQEIKALGYTGSLSHLHRFLTKWRTSKPVASSPAPRVETIAAIDAVTGWRISPVIAASLCMKPRGMLTPRQAAKVDALKSASADFAAMRRLVMEFRGVVKSKRADKLDKWLKDATASGIYAMRRFVRTLRQDIDAVRNAITEPWSNGQTEGQINRLKTLKRSMYGRAGLELLRARMLPIRRYNACASTEFEEEPYFSEHRNR